MQLQLQFLMLARCEVRVRREGEQAEMMCLCDGPRLGEREVSEAAKPSWR
jgi:hypothetical protein